MKFADFLREKRIENNYSLDLLAELSNTDKSTINRIENSLTEARFLTAFKCLSVLDIPYYQAYTELSENVYAIPEFDKEALTYKKIDRRLKNFAENQIYELEAVTNEIAIILEFLCLPFASLVQDAHKLIFENDLYDFRLKYPKIHPMSLMQVDNVIYYQDVFNYKKTLNSIERILFEEVIKIDKATNQDGLLFVLCWKAAETFFYYKNLQAWEKRYVELLLLIYRWKLCVNSI